MRSLYAAYGAEKLFSLVNYFFINIFRCRWTKNFTTMERWSRLTYTSKTTQTSPWKRSKCQSANLPIFASFRRPSTNVRCQNKKASKLKKILLREKLVKLQHNLKILLQFVFEKDQSVRSPVCRYLLLFVSPVQVFCEQENEQVHIRLKNSSKYSKKWKSFCNLTKKIKKIKVSEQESEYLTANIFESGPMPTPWNFLDCFQVVN